MDLQMYFNQFLFLWWFKSPVFTMTSEHAILCGGFQIVLAGFFCLTPSGKRVSNIQCWEKKSHSISRVTDCWYPSGICRAQALVVCLCQSDNADMRPCWALSLLEGIGVLSLAPGHNRQELHCILCHIGTKRSSRLFRCIHNTFNKHTEL